MKQHNHVRNLPKHKNKQGKLENGRVGGMSRRLSQFTSYYPLASLKVDSRSLRCIRLSCVQLYFALAQAGSAPLAHLRSDAKLSGSSIFTLSAGQLPPLKGTSGSFSSVAVHEVGIPRKLGGPSAS